MLASTGLPGDRAPEVAGLVDRALREPVGARAFVDPFAGSWARLLGEDDPRPAVFDLGPVVDAYGGELLPPGVDTSVLDGARVDVPSVPLPRARLGWLGAVRRGVDAAVGPLALAAAALALLALAVGDRRRVLRSVGVWGVLAGLAWVAVPPLATWAASSWFGRADAIVEVAVREATAGLRPTAIALVAAGAVLVLGSVLVPTGPRVARSAPMRRARRGGAGRAAPAGSVVPSAPRRAAPASHATSPGPASPHRGSRAPAAATHLPAGEPTPRSTPVVGARPGDATRPMSSTDAPRRDDGERGDRRGAGAPVEDDVDDVWDFYG